MNDLIARLGNFLNNVVPKTAAISLPGVLGALLLAFAIWPPIPHDEIACVTNLDQVEGFNGVARTPTPPVGCAAESQLYLAADPVYREIAPGESTTFTVKPSSPVVSSNQVSFEVRGLPAGVNAVYSPQTLTSGSISTVLTISATDSAPQGTYTLTLLATNGATANSSFIGSTSAELTISSASKGSGTSAIVKRKSANEFGSVCQFRMRSLAALVRYSDTGTAAPHGDSWSLESAKTFAFQNQEVLDGARLDMEECARLEGSHVGVEQNLIDNLKYAIIVKEKERDSLQAQYLSYEKSGSRLRDDYLAKFNAAKIAIEGYQRQIVDKEADLRKREAHVDLENAFLKEINARLQDPGRIRPAVSFDDFFAGLANHALAVALLAVGVGLVLDPINKALWGAIFDRFAVQFLNRYRLSRPPAIRPLRPTTPPPVIASAMAAGGPPAPVGAYWGDLDFIRVKITK